MFATFRQNNSGGGFDIDENKGISIDVIVEADNEDEAVDRALQIGIYLDGCLKGIDCSCCGNRWSDLISLDEVPCHFSTPIDMSQSYQEYVDGDGDIFTMKWAPEGTPEGYVHYKDGTVKGFWS